MDVLSYCKIKPGQAECCSVAHVCAKSQPVAFIHHRSTPWMYLSRSLRTCCIPLPFWYRLRIETFLLFSPSSIYCEVMAVRRSATPGLSSFVKVALKLSLRHSVPPSLLSQFLEEVSFTEVIYLKNPRTQVRLRFLGSKNCKNRTNCRYLHPDFLTNGSKGFALIRRVAGSSSW